MKLQFSASEQYQLDAIHAVVDLFSAILAEKPQKIICFDRAFAGNDQLKTNLLLQAEDAGVQEVGVI